MYEPFLHKRASKYYNGLDDKTARRINKAVEEIATDPFEGRHIKKLRGKLEGKQRYALGDLRIVYEVDEGRRQVLIIAIGPRGDVYK